LHSGLRSAEPTNVEDRLPFRKARSLLQAEASGSALDIPRAKKLVGRLSKQSRQSGTAKLVKRLPPTRAAGVGTLDDHEVQSEVGEDMLHPGPHRPR
jgi:hypothetical protein